MDYSVVQRLAPEVDQLKAMLREALMQLSDDTVRGIVNDLCEQFQYPEGLSPAEQLEVHMMLVGILTVMTESIEAGEANA